MRAAERAPWHPGRCAEVVVGDDGDRSRRRAAPAGLRGLRAARRARVALEVDLDVLMARGPEPRRARALDLPARQGGRRAGRRRRAAGGRRSAATLREGAGELLESVRLFDVYTGDQVGEGRKFARVRAALPRPRPDADRGGDQRSPGRRGGARRRAPRSGPALTQRGLEPVCGPRPVRGSLSNVTAMVPRARSPAPARERHKPRARPGRGATMTKTRASCCSPAVGVRAGVDPRDRVASAGRATGLATPGAAIRAETRREPVLLVGGSARRDRRRSRSSRSRRRALAALPRERRAAARCRGHRRGPAGPGPPDRVASPGCARYRRRCLTRDGRDPRGSLVAPDAGPRRRPARIRAPDAARAPAGARRTGADTVRARR